VHRDIKPENLFLAETSNGVQTVKILDFGVSKRLGARGATLTSPGQSVGSPLYMSPEQMRSPSDVDSRTDIWSLGVTLYQLLSGQLPFDGETIPEICAKVLAESPRSLRELRPDIPTELEAIVFRCLEKDRERRFASVEKLAGEIERFGQQSEPSSRRRLVSTSTESDVAFDVTRLDVQGGSEARSSWLGLALGLGVAIGAASFAHARGYVNLAAPFEGVLVPARLGPGPEVVEEHSDRTSGPLFFNGPRIQQGRAVPNLISAQQVSSA
jgi:serine/threonine protein kinase